MQKDSSRHAVRNGRSQRPLHCTLLLLVVGISPSVAVSQDTCADLLAAERALTACNAAADAGRCGDALTACRDAVTACGSVPRFADRLAAVERQCATAPSRAVAAGSLNAPCRTADQCGDGLTCRRRTCQPRPDTPKRIASYRGHAATILGASPCDARQLLERACMLTRATTEDVSEDLARELNDARTVCPRYDGDRCPGQAGIAGADGVEMVLVPKGTFLRGSNDQGVKRGLKICRQTYTSPHECNEKWFAREVPRRSIEVSSFYIDKVEVTNAQFQRCIDGGGCKPIEWSECSLYEPATGRWNRGGKPHPSLTKPDHPVVCATWKDAADYCKWSGKRLPTEAEWEKAARGADDREFPWGNEWDSNNLNWGETTGFGTQDSFETTSPVGSFPNAASPFGVLDMSGNVWEWTADFHADDFYARSAKSDPLNSEASDARVMRGGSWSFAGNGARVSYRYFAAPETRDDAVGFRCARSSEK